jgi:hypothetical protein
MIAFINSMVAGAGVALLANQLAPGRTTLALGLGVATTLLLMAGFLLFQRWRYSVSAPSLSASREEEVDRRPPTWR